MKILKLRNERLDLFVRVPTADPLVGGAAVQSMCQVRMADAGHSESRVGGTAMDFFEVIRRRRSVRAFTRKTIPTETLEIVLEAANAAPSAGNLQAYEIYLVTDERRRIALAHAAKEQFFLAGAPVLLVFCTHAARAGKYGQRGATLYSVQDATIACTFAMLAAAAQGLATVWVGAFHPDDVARIVNAPSGVEPVAILPVVYPAEEPAEPARRPLYDLVHRIG